MRPTRASQLLALIATTACVPFAQLLDPATTYRVAVNSFIAAGGDNFFVLNEGRNRVIGAVDLDALVDYVQSLTQPFAVAIEGRIQRVN